MRKLFVAMVLSIGAVMIATSSVGALSSPSTGSARLHPYDRSGVKARMSFIDTHDDNTGLIVSGTATGLDPDKLYVSPEGRRLVSQPTTRLTRKRCLQAHGR